MSDEITLKTILHSIELLTAKVDGMQKSMEEQKQEIQEIKQATKQGFDSLSEKMDILKEHIYDIEADQVGLTHLVKRQGREVWRLQRRAGGEG